MPKLLSVGPYNIICILVLTAAIGGLFLTGPGFLQLPEVALGLGFAPLAVYVALTCPVVLCTLFIIVSHFRIHEAFPFLLPFHLPLVLAILSLMSVFAQMVRNQVRSTWCPPFKLLIVLFAFVVVSCVTSTNQATSFTALGDLAKIFLMTFVIAWLFREPKHFRFITRAVIIGGTSIALVAIDNYVSGFDLIAGRVRIGGMFNSSIGDPNDLCLVLLFAWSFSLAVIVIRPSLVDCILALISTPALLWAMVATQSRGGLMGVLAVFAIIGLQKSKSKSVIAVTCFAAVASIYVAMGLGDRVDSFEQGSSLDDSAQSRLNAWIAAIKMGVSRPIWGVGLNTFGENLWGYIDEKWVGFHDMAAHSTWLTVLAEIGVPGFVAFVMMVGSTWKACRHNLIALERHKSKALKVIALGLMGGVAGFCASGTFLSQAFGWPMYIFVGLTVSLSKYLDGPAKSPAKLQCLPERIEIVRQRRG
jgi:probable O-glycosylation ligase (exosortase A-associated)